jgi:hypothetical protein
MLGDIELSNIELISILISLLSLLVSAQFVSVNRKNSRKARIYSEEVFCSTVVVTSLNTDRGQYTTKKDDDLVLKIYSLNE